MFHLLTSVLTMNLLRYLLIVVTTALIGVCGRGIAEVVANQSIPQQRPNIVWIIAEDMCPFLGCYGDKQVKTPHLDSLATKGTLFEQAFTTAPICSPSRSALITGMYQTSINAHHHRSGRGDAPNVLPNEVKPIPMLMKKAGYYTANAQFGVPTPDGIPSSQAWKQGKTDYNFQFKWKDLYDGTDWRDRKPGQPFFIQIQLWGGKWRDSNYSRMLKTLSNKMTPASDCNMPPYYPTSPKMLEDWAKTLDAIRMTDMAVGEIVKRLQQDGLLENTVIWFISDHGVSHVRGKQFLYDEGIHIPMIVMGPTIPQGQRRVDLVEHIDMAAATLGLAGVPIPKSMQGRDILNPATAKRNAVYGARDRADETEDRIRSVRTSKWKYIRNYHPQRPYLQPNAYKDSKPCLIEFRRAEKAGELNDAQKLIAAMTRPKEELYNLKDDPYEIRNLALDPNYAEILDDLRKRMDIWIRETGDKGEQPEPKQAYDAAMKNYRTRDPQIETNIHLMEQWRKEGK